MHVESKETELTKTVDGQLPGPGGGGYEERLVKGHRLQLKRHAFRDLMCSMVTVANNTVLYTFKLLTECMFNILTVTTK